MKTSNVVKLLAKVRINVIYDTFTNLFNFRTKYEHYTMGQFYPKRCKKTVVVKIGLRRFIIKN
jgi:hypothetical protein